MSDLALTARLLRHARPYWKHIAGVFVISLLSTPLALLAPLPLKIAVDSAIGSHPLPGFIGDLVPGTSDATVLAVAAGMLIAVALLTELQGLAKSLLTVYTGERLVLGFRSALFQHVQRLSLSYHDSKGIADSTYRIQYDAPAIQSVALNGVIPLVVSALTFASMLYVTARLDWQLALVALVVSPVLFLLARLSRTRLRSQWREVKSTETGALAVVQEVLGSLRVVRAFGQEDREQARFVARGSEGMYARLRVSVFEGVLTMLIGLVSAVGTGAVLIIGVLHVKSGRLTLGELLLVMGYLSQLYRPLHTLSKSIATLQSSLTSAERAFALLDQQPDVFEREGAQALERAHGSITFEGVSFSHDGVRPALDSVSFELRHGMTLGVVGATGAGKTTLVSLLARIHDPDGGRVTLDGVDLRDYRLADLRSQFAIVLQEPVLFSTTIAENIAYGRPGATYAEILTAAVVAGAHRFISALEHGYETEVGERGMQLSGGERQRISLARAFLKDAPILILDEPTSAVDAKTEAGIIQTLERLRRGRTTIVVTHRSAPLQGCDLVLELDRGRVADRRAPGQAAPAAVAGLDDLLRKVGEPALPELRACLKELLETLGARSHVVAAERLKARVHRVLLEVDGAPRTLVLKRLHPEAAKRNELAITRWLPAVGLQHAAPDLLATMVQRDGRAVWHVYEDVGSRSLRDGEPSDAEIRGAVELIAELHMRFAAHPLLPEARVWGGDLGIAFYAASVRDAIAGLESMDIGALGLAGEHVDVRARLLARLYALRDEQSVRTRLLERVGGPDTLLHGDLWTTNVVLGPDPASSVRLIDWDHAGVGPVGYDLSVFLRRFETQRRPAILAYYRQAVRSAGWVLPPAETLNAVFQTTELARLVNSVVWPTVGVYRGRLEWALDELAAYDGWIDELTPLLPPAAVAV